MKKAAKGQRLSFRNNYLALILLLFSFSTVTGQKITYTPMPAAGYQFKYLKADSGLNVPNRDTSTGRGTSRSGSIVFDSTHRIFYGWDGIRWTALGNGVGSVVTILNDSSVQVCNNNSCDTFHVSVTANNFSILNDSTLIVCDVSNVCDTINIGGTTFLFSDTSLITNIVNNIFLDSARNLQQVTDIGNTTTNPMVSSNAMIISNASGNISMNTIPGDPALTWTLPYLGNSTNLRADSADNRNLQLPNADGYLATTVNGIPADVTGNIVTHFTDTAFVQSLIHDSITTVLIGPDTTFLIRPLRALNDSTEYLDTFYMPQLRYINATRDTTLWTDSTLVDRQYLRDRIAGFGTGTGTVTSVGTGYGLSGGPITTTGTIIVDSAALSLKYLRIVDTANMRLRPVAGTNVTITGTYPNLTFNASGSSQTLAQTLGFGRTVTTDSILSTSLTIRGKTVFDSTVTGNDYPRIGLLVNEGFNGGSTPSGWTVGGSLSVSYTGSKATITGASSLGTPVGSSTTAYTSGLQYNTRRMPYEKVDFQMSIVPTTKSANAIVGVAYGNLGLTVFGEQGIFWDLSNGTNSGRVTINYAGNVSLALPTFTTNVDSTSKLNFSTGDSLILYFKKNGWSVTAGIINKTTGKASVTTFNQRWSGSGGRWNLVFLNGTYVLTGAKVNVLDRKGGVWFIGDSHTGGYGNSQESRRYPNLLFQSNYKYFGVIGLPSLSAKAFVDGGLPAEVIADAAPAKAVVELGYNDETEVYSAPNTKAYVDSIVFPMQRAGITVGVANIVPRNNATDIWSDSILNLATQRGADPYDVRTLLKTSTGTFNSAYNFDGVHINDSGAIVVANIIRAKSGDSLLSEMAADTIYTQKIYNVKNSEAETTVNLLGLNDKNELVKLPPKLPTEAAWIKNNYTVNQGTGTAQLNAAVAVAGYVRSDSGLIARGVQGGHIGFFDGTSSNTGGANIQITNMADGTGTLQAWEAMTGAGNIFMFASSANKVKASASTISGSNNTVINSNASTTLSGNENIKIGNYYNTTSGSNNIFLGPYAGYGIGSGSSVLHLGTTTTGGGYTLPTGLSNAIIIGESWTYNPRGYVAGDVVLSTFYATATHNFWFGGITNTGPTNWNFPGANAAGVNKPGTGGYIRSSMGTGLAQSGALYFQTFDNTTTGSTYHSTGNSKMMIDFTGVGIGSTTVTTKVADAVLDITSTTQGLLPPRMTTAQRDLVVTGVQTLAKNAGGTLYTDGNVGLVFSGGAGSGAAGYAVISGGSVSSAVLTARGSGYTSAPTATLTSGPGTGATFTITIGGTAGLTVYCSDCTATDASTGVIQTWNGTAWKNHW